MTDHDQNAIDAMVASMQPAHTMQGFAINILDAIRAGKVPGIVAGDAQQAQAARNTIAILTGERDRIRSEYDAYFSAARKHQEHLQACISYEVDKRQAQVRELTTLHAREIAALRAERDAAESKALAVHEVLTKERDAALARAKELEGELSYIRGLHMSSAELVGADYVAYQDETPALIARMFKDSEQQRDALKADNERLREIIAAIRIHEPCLPAGLRNKVLAVFDERIAAMSNKQELGQ